MSPHTPSLPRTAALVACLLGGCGPLDTPGAGDRARRSEETTTSASGLFNGMTASVAQNPATVAIYHGFMRPCSGTLLRPTWVLTARHCLAMDPFDTDGPLLWPGQVQVAPPNVVTPTHPTEPGLHPPSGAVTARRLIEYEPQVDLALIELSSPLAPPGEPSCYPGFDPYCEPAAAPPRALGLWNGETADLTLPNHPVRVMGYGVTSGNGTLGAGQLRMGDTTISTTEPMFLHLAGGPGVPELQPGDSGGSTYTLSDRFGRSVFGLGGWNIARTSTCGSVADFRNWIRRTMAFSGNVDGGVRPDIALVGGTGFGSFYWASPTGNGTFTHHEAARIICDYGTCWVVEDELPNFAWAAQQSGVRPVGGDFNGDDMLDVALLGVGGSESTTLLIAFSEGSGSHGVASREAGAIPALARTPGARGIAGDFNGDGISDIALTAGSGWSGIPVAWGKNGSFVGTNTFVPDFPAFSRTGNAQTLSGDFDGDGRDDLALTSGPWGFIPLALSKGDGSFLVRTESVGIFASWAQDSGVKAVSGDFNGDGRDDIALTGGVGWGSVPVAFSVGDGTFWVTNEPLADFPGFSREDGAKAVTGDFDGDGRDDIALAGGVNWNTVPVAYSVGDGSFRVTNGAAGTFAVLARNANATPLAVGRGETPRAIHPTLEIAAGRNADGRLEVFYAGINTLLYRNRQLTPNGQGWSGEIPMGGAAKKIAVGRNDDGRLELFYVGTDDRLYHKWQLTPNGPRWSNDTAFGGSFARELVATRNADGRLEIFYTRASDGVIFHNFQNEKNGGWHGELPLNGGAGKRLAVELANDKLSLFVIGTNDQIYLIQQAPTPTGWSDWSWLGGKAKELAVARNQDGRLRVFYIADFGGVGEANRIRTHYQLADGSWSGDTAFSNGPERALRLTVAYSDDGKAELLIANDIAGALMRWSQETPNADFTGPQWLAGPTGYKAIAAAGQASNGVFYLGRNNVIHGDSPGGDFGAHTATRLIGDGLGAREMTKLCGIIGEPDAATLTCPVGQLISGVLFASYGTPTGSCGTYEHTFQVSPSCNAGNSLDIIRGACVGKPSCTLLADNTVFGDPCSGVPKRLNVFLQCY